jgi:hypothetical protein
MDYLMNEEIKSEIRRILNVSQSDLRSLVRGELNVFKANLVPESEILNTKRNEDASNELNLY